MTNLRGWVLVLALVSFAVGLASGFWMSAQSFRPEPTRGPFADYQDLLVENFDLAPARARVLGTVLATYQKEIEAIKDQHMADYMSAMEPALRERGRYYRDLIQNRVLPENQRSKFDSPEFVQLWPSPRP